MTPYHPMNHIENMSSNPIAIVTRRPRCPLPTQIEIARTEKLATSRAKNGVKKRSGLLNASTPTIVCRMTTASDREAYNQMGSRIMDVAIWADKATYI